MAPKKRRHRISDVDEDARTGTCSVCGDGVDLYRINNRTAGVISWRCRKASSPTRAYVTKDGGHRIHVAPDDREALLNAAGGRCAICNRKVTVRTMRADHKHGTSEFRGVLCARCNQGLGHFGDDLDLLREAVRYLESFEEQGCALVRAQAGSTVPGQ